MMFPRVLGLYLSLVIMSPLMTKNVSATHYMDCQDAGDLNHYFFNFCEEKCVCEEVSPGIYDHVCYREREEFTCMSTARRERFLNAYKAVTTAGHPQYYQMKQLIDTHGKIIPPSGNHFFDIHSQAYFLPWHRWYAMAMETVLRNYDCRITLPWWRWSKKPATWWTGSPFLSANNWLGTDSNDACQIDGAFKPPWMPSDSSPVCLRHDFVTSPFPSYSDINHVMGMPHTDYGAFTLALESVHNDPHCLIGADMCSFMSPRSPVFFLHHGYIDQLWDRWQRKSADHLASYNCPLCNINAALPHTVGGTPYTVSENFDLAATRVRYVNYRSSDPSLNHNNMHFSPNLCMLLVATVNEAKKSLFWNIGVLEDALYGEVGNGIMKDVPQLRPETPDFDTMKKRLIFFYEGVTDKKQLEMLDSKITWLVQNKEKFANSITNPLSEEELHKLAGANEASKMLGFDLGSDQIADLFEKLEMCPSIYDTWNKGKCKPSKKKKIPIKKELKKGTILGGEVMYKSYLPKCYDKPYSSCQKQNGICVSLKECDKTFEGCEPICSTHKSCVCKIQSKCVADDKNCKSINGKCVPKSLCEAGEDCQDDACAGPGCTCKVQPQCGADNGKCEEMQGVCVPKSSCNRGYDGGDDCWHSYCEGDSCTCKLRLLQV